MQNSLPLIRLSAISPILLELRRRGLDAESLLRDFELPTDVPASDELFVASNAIYLLIEQSAKVADDHNFGFTVGNTMDLHRWDPISQSVEEANTAGELLTRFTMHAVDHSSATRYYINARGYQSIFGFERSEKPSITPAQNDAFYVGFMSRMLRHAARNRWDASAVLFRVADPSCIPNIRNDLRIAKGDRMGIHIVFPSSWLFEPFEKSHFRSQINRDVSHEVPDSLLTSIRIALRPHVHETGLSVDRAAKICGHSRRRLSRRLREEGTTLSKEIAKLRAQRAEAELANSDHRVADIARNVGFQDATIFSRAFKNWTGQSPQEYRRNHKPPS